jgi:methylated-DNA-[protein]-cysteine S-methyltransferase
MARLEHRFFLDRLASPLGALSLVHDEEGRLRALDFEDHGARMMRLLARHYGAGRYTLGTGRAPATLGAPLAAFFAGDIAAIDAIAVATGGTDFQRRVWAALRRIPVGTTTSYGQLASALGCAGASRAVGLANGSNPVVVVVPCHRVIGADGTLTGYGGGLERKRWLLAHERRWTATAAFSLEATA